jgi:hypothetical protein
MTPEIRLAGIFASATFLIIGIRSYILTDDPLHAMLFGLGASLLLAFVGYQIGNITSHPRGNRPAKPGSKDSAPSGVKGTHLSGEETFLDDLGS